jgi:hypothetical protein
MRRPLLSTVLIVTAASGCALVQPVEFPDVIYQCEDGSRFRAVMTPTRATVVLPNGRRYEMTGTMRQDYARFSNGTVTLTGGRYGVVLDTPERLYRRCWLAENAAE